MDRVKLANDVTFKRYVSLGFCAGISLKSYAKG